jgi:heptosyltransferase-1
VIDAQGLMKSALLSRMAKGDKCGLHGSVARESLAALAYRQKFKIAKGQHAITRARQLFANCLGYAEPTDTLDYGIDGSRFAAAGDDRPRLVFLHGTTWPTKLWPELYWAQLANMAATEGFRVLLPWGNDEERDRAKRIATGCVDARVLARCTQEPMAAYLVGARAVVAVDTGLGHLAAALSVPSVTIYGATKPGLTGTMGESQLQLCADFPCSPCLQRHCSYRGDTAVTPACYASVDPERVWQKISALIS